jgi:hypothetical protein
LSILEATTVSHRGTILVLLLLAAGLIAAGTAIWHQHRQTRQALDFWGPQAAYLVGHAPVVTLKELKPDGGSPARLAESRGETEAKAPRGKQRPIDISQARGLIHFRRSLLEDANFDWDAEPPATRDGGGGYEVRFSDDEQELVVVFDLDQRRVEIQSPGDGTVKLTERMAEGVTTFLADALAQATE